MIELENTNGHETMAKDNIYAYDDGITKFKKKINLNSPGH